jgi:hypothetical protein
VPQRGEVPPSTEERTPASPLYPHLSAVPDYIRSAWHALGFKNLCINPESDTSVESEISEVCKMTVIVYMQTHKNATRVTFARLPPCSTISGDMITVEVEVFDRSSVLWKKVYNDYVVDNDIFRNLEPYASFVHIIHRAATVSGSCQDSAISSIQYWIKEARRFLEIANTVVPVVGLVL